MIRNFRHVIKNWRVTFRFSESDAIDVNYRDYH